MDIDDVKITHKVEARGEGRPTAAIIAALAALVPDEAHVSSHSGTDRNEAYWSWSAEWDHQVDTDWNYTDGVLPDAPDQHGQPMTALDLLGRTEETTEDGLLRCLAWSDARAVRVGYQVGKQCRLRAGHSPLRNGTGHDYPKVGDQ